MGIDINKLEGLATRASKGPWRLRTMGNDCFVEAPGSPDMPYRLDVCGDDYTGHGDEQQRRWNMQYIAAADPEVILALIARLREVDQGWPTPHAYEAACAALRKHRGRADQAEAREQALAAHVRLVRQRAQNVTEDGSSKNWTALRVDALRAPDATSLARLKAECKAEALELVASDPMMRGLPRHHLREKAAKYRHLAEETKS